MSTLSRKTSAINHAKRRQEMFFHAKFAQFLTRCFSGEDVGLLSPSPHCYTTGGYSPRRHALKNSSGNTCRGAPCMFAKGDS